MPQALDTISGFVTAPSSTFTAWSLASGDSLQVKNATPGKKVLLVSAWAWNQVAGSLRVRSALLHDNVQCIRQTVLANDVEPEWSDPVAQTLFTQDNLIVEHTGSGVGGQIETGSLLVYYEDLPGATARFMSPSDVSKAMVNLYTTDLTLAPGTAGGYTGQAALNSGTGAMKSGKDYAYLGVVVSARAATVSLRGPDTSNLRVSVPAEPTKRDVGRRWFWRLSEALGVACIPVIAANNAASTFVDCVANQAGTAITATLIFAQVS